jgi:hypothetical protein
MIAYSTIRDFLFQERRRIKGLGGDDIPVGKIDDFMSRYDDCVTMRRENVEAVILDFLNPYELTIPAKWAEHCKTLKAALLKSSRFTRLRMSRGLPFKSHRQPV